MLYNKYSRNKNIGIYLILMPYLKVYKLIVLYCPLSISKPLLLLILYCKIRPAVQSGTACHKFHRLLNLNSAVCPRCQYMRSYQNKFRIFGACVLGGLPIFTFKKEFQKNTKKICATTIFALISHRPVENDWLCSLYLDVRARIFKKIVWHWWGSSLAGPRILDPPLSPSLTPAEFVSRTCLGRKVKFLK